MMGIESKNLLTIGLDMPATQKALRKKASIARKIFVVRMLRFLREESSTKPKGKEEGVEECLVPVDLRKVRRTDTAVCLEETTPSKYSTKKEARFSIS